LTRSVSDTYALLLTSHIHHTVPANQHANSQPLLVLFYEQARELRVLLTTRSKSLRANPWQTALPGGKADEEGESLIRTAVSNGSPIIRHSSASFFPRLRLLLFNYPFHSSCSSTKQMKLLFLSRPHHLRYTLSRLSRPSSPHPLVTPVVAFLLSLCSQFHPSLSLVSDDLPDATSDTPSSPSSHPILKSLTPSLTEVERIFNHPVEAVLDHQLLLNNGELLVGEGEDWPYNAR
jgi:coenzyme A diphosphatase NUDT7